MFLRFQRREPAYSRLEEQNLEYEKVQHRISFTTVLLIILLAGSVALNTFYATKQNSLSDSLLAYSPAQDVLKPSTVVFEHGFGLDSTPFSGPPSPSNEAAWQSLYQMGISRINADEARRMVNKTLPIPGDEDHYIVQLSVFHTLHCLNQIRKALYEGFNPDNLHFQGKLHVDHCISAIRQSLTCNADITPLTWGRDRESGSAKVLMQVPHTCRNFDDIRDWANKHTLKVPFNWTAEVSGDPLGWGNHYLQDVGLKPATSGLE